METDQPLVLLGGTIVDVVTGTATTDGVLVVEKDRISLVRRRDGFSPVPGSQVIDTSGAWLVPGLVDMHVHLPFQSPQSSLLPLYLAHGVTTVRDTGGSLTELASLRQASEAGDRLAPRVFFVGPLLDGMPPLWPNHTLLVDTVPRARAAVRMLVSQNVDCIKIYNSVPEESLVAIVEEAHAAGLLVLGHVPRSISMTRAVNIGMDCLEHIRITGRELLPPDAADQIEYLPLGTRETLLWDRFELESDGMGRLIGLLAESKVFLDPTLIVDADMFAGGVTDNRASEVEEKLPEATLEALRRDRHLDPLRAPEELKEKSLKGYEKRLKFIEMCNAAGVRILAGTDVFGPGALLPGVSLLNELVLLQRAGLSPVEALRAATITAAAALQRESDLGSLEMGKLADVVVLDADPLANADNLRSIRTIVKNGKTYTPSALIQSAANGGRA